MTPDQCCWPGCGQPVAIGWLGRLVCEAHWEKVCSLTASGPGGYREAYAALRVPKRLWAKFPAEHAESAEFEDLPDPDKFDYSSGV
jgi:hypothetical protein